MGQLLLVLAVCATVPSTFAHQDPDIAGYIAVDGGNIWYRLNGHQWLGKKPAIIVIHGGPGGTHRDTLPYLALADDYPVILYDQLDTGKSTRTDNPKHWQVARFVAEITHLRKALALNQVIIAGHSWGGSLAAEYALQQVDGVQGIILSSPLISTQQWNADNRAWAKQLPATAYQALYQHLEAGSTNHPDFIAAQALFNSRHMCRKDPCPVEHFYNGKAPANQTVYETMWGKSDFYGDGTLKDYDISNKLRAIKVPSLVICGEFDEAAPTSCNRYAKLLKGSLVIVPDAGHATPLEQPTVYIQAVRAFIDGLPR